MQAERNGVELDLTDIFTSTRFKRLPLQWTKEQRYYPNELWHSETDRTTLIVAKKSARSNGDFSLNEKALTDMLAKVQAGRIARAYVVFVERHGRGAEAVSYKTVEAMAAIFDNIRPDDGLHGPFWWIDPDTASADGGYVPLELRPL